MSRPKILLLQFESTNGASTILRTMLEESLGETTIQETSADDRDLMALSSRFDPDLVFLCTAGGSTQTSHAIISKLHNDQPALPIILIGELKDTDEVLALLNVGAADFIVPPFKKLDIVPRVKRLLEPDTVSPVRKIKASMGLKQLIGQSRAFASEVAKIPTMASCDATVLISGETGTGKELCARAIHYLSPRSGRPFVPVNCGAIPADLAENELFGHARGAYTGASSSQPGMIHEASGGTLFLDEIDCLSPLTQVNLLRFLQEKEYRPLGSSKVRQTDIRVIAATNNDLDKLVKQGQFRQDFYYRLNIIPFNLVPLRDRSDDIPLLARHFLNLQSKALRKSATDISMAAMQKLMLHGWPGNVRELEHVIERAVVMCEDEALTEHDIKILGVEHESSSTG